MPDGQAVRCEAQQIDDGLLVSVYGDIDFSTTPELRAGLMSCLEQAPQRLVLDVQGVPYMDSSGVATLVEVLQAQRQAGRRLVLCNLQPKVRGIFEIARLDMVFTIVENAEAARTV